MTRQHRFRSATGTWQRDLQLFAYYCYLDLGGEPGEI